MKGPTFPQGVVFALVAAALAAAAYAALDVVVTSTVAIKIVIAALGGAYVLYLLRSSAERTGRLAVPALWSCAALGAWAFSPNLALYLAAHVTLIWLVRALYHHASVMPALLDLALGAFAALAAVAAARSTHSVLIAVWTFFLVQALFVVVPTLLTGSRPRTAEPTDMRFRRALRSAESAVRRMHATS